MFYGCCGISAILHKMCMSLKAFVVITTASNSIEVLFTMNFLSYTCLL